MLAASPKRRQRSIDAGISWSWSGQMQESRVVTPPKAAGSLMVR